MAREGQTDGIQIGFKGMATAGGYYSADSSYLQSLTNAYVTQDGTLRRRTGSTFVYAVGETTLTPEVFQFSFGGFKWMIHRRGTNFTILKVYERAGVPYTVEALATKTDVLRPQSANEPATYAAYNSGDYCHVLIATKSTQLVSLTLGAREIAFVTLPTATTATARVSQWLTGNNTSSSNSKLQIDGEAFLSPVTAITNASDTYSFTWAARPSSVVIGATAKLFQCFWLRYVDSNYYQGNSLYDSALRRNSVPLDVNVELSASVSDNPIFNEPIQDLDYETYRVYDSNITASTALTKVTNRQPLVNNAWDFGDGSYRALSSQLSNRTPKFVSFGGLLSGGNVNTRVYVSRLRTILVGGFSYPSISDLRVISDKALVTNNSWHSFTGTNITSGEPKYFSFVATGGTPPGVNQDAIVELTYRFNAAGGSFAEVYADISRDRDSHTISDGALVPLYGYGLLTKTKNFKFPNIVRVVGNRLILSGESNLILVGSSNWNYRGFSFTNLQITAQDFSENSAYLLELSQNTSKVNDIISVNGVLVVTTDVGVFTIAGSERTNPPNAMTASVSKLSDQVFDKNCALVLNNTVHLTNDNGLFKLNYARETDVNLLDNVSLPVSNLFAAKPVAITYSNNNNSILIKREGRPKLLTYNVLSETWSYTQASVSFEMQLFPSFDGFVIATGTYHVISAFDSDVAIDFWTVETFVTPVFTALSATVTTTPALFTEFVSPTELANNYLSSGAGVVPAYDNKLRSVSGASVLTETTAGNVAKPVLASAVTKAVYTDKLQRGQRVREVFALFRRTGTAKVNVIELEADNNQLPTTNTITIASDGTYTMDGDRQKNVPNFVAGDTVVVSFSTLGLGESFVLAVELGNTEFVGFQFNTSAKSLSKLN
jgi:hypothetical protein